MIVSQCRAPYIVTNTRVSATGKVSFIVKGPNLVHGEEFIFLFKNRFNLISHSVSFNLLL